MLAQQNYFGIHAYEPIGRENIFEPTEWLPVPFNKNAKGISCTTNSNQIIRTPGALEIGCLLPAFFYGKMVHLKVPAIAEKNTTGFFSAIAVQSRV